MDKQTLTGLIIMGAILFGFTWYNSGQQREAAILKAKADSIEMVRSAKELANSNIGRKESSITSINDNNPATADSTLAKSIGSSLVAATHGEVKTYSIENDLMTITFSNKGAKIENVVLKDYKKYNGDPLSMFSEGSSRFNLELFIKQNFSDAQIDSENFYFSCDAPATSTISGDQQQMSLKLHVDSTAYIEYLYTIYKDNYMIDFDVNFVGMSNILSNQSNVSINWGSISPQNEKGFENENNYTTAAYMFPDSKTLEELAISKGSESEEIDTKVNWVAFKQQFFSSIFVAKDDFQSTTIQYSPSSTVGNIKSFDATMTIPFNAQETSYNFQYYFGPNKYPTLESYDLGFEKLIPLGWGIFGWINRWLIIPVFDFLGKHILNYGIIILILTIFIKVLIAPLTYKSYLSSAKMRLLKPDIDKLTEKFPKKEDAIKKQQAVMELYRNAGVSPMGGCLPMLIQFPVLIAMFRFFPSSIELRGEKFLWAEDLSSYDSIFNLPFDIPFYGDHVSLFTILMAVSVYISSRISYAQTAQSAPQMAGMKFMMLYMMPAMLLLWFNNYSSGLSYYYLVSNIITIGQTYAFRYAVDDNKLHSQMKNNAKKPKKKSKWQTKYDDMIKIQQQQAKGKK